MSDTAETTAAETKTAKKKSAAKKKGETKTLTQVVGATLLKKTELPKISLIHANGGCIIKSAMMNQRDQFPHLTDKGYPLFKEHDLGETDKEPIVEMLLSDDPIKRADAVAIIEELEPKLGNELSGYMSQGILQNIEIRIREDGYGDLVYGNLRVALVAYAYAKTGRKTPPLIPAKVTDGMDKSTAAARSTIENLSRYSEGPVDQARRFKQYDVLGLTAKQISDATGGRIGPQTILDRLSLLDPKIPDDVRAKINTGEIGADRAIDMYIRNKKTSRPLEQSGLRLKYDSVYNAVYVNGVAPKDESIKCPTLVRSWIAKNLLQIPEDKIKTVEETKADAQKAAEKEARAKAKAAKDKEKAKAIAGAIA